MPVFEYVAKNAEGQVKRGTLVSGSLELAQRQLVERGYLIETLTPFIDLSAGHAQSEAAPGREAETVMHGGAVPLQHLAFFFRQAAALIGAGVSPSHAFETLSRQTKNPRLHRVLDEFRSLAIAGQPMSDAMRRNPDLFTPLMLALVRAGESGGFLVDSLKAASDYAEREIELRNRIRRQTLYPKLVLAASVIIFAGANLIIGSITGTGGGLPNPLLSPAAMAIWIPLVVGLWLYVRVGLKNPRIKLGYDRLITQLPAIGQVVEGLVMAKFGRAFGALYKGGVPVQDAVLLAADACGNTYLAERIRPASERLGAGQGITDSFRATGAFTDIVLDMCAAGEQSGNLDEMLTKVAEYYEDEGKTRSDQMATLLGVFCLLAVGIYVGFLLVQAYGGYASGRTGLME